jgi:hypothetical protein
MSVRFDKLLKTNWDSGQVRILDWVLTLAVLGLGFWLGSWWLIGFGAVGAAFTLFRPLGKAQAKLNTSLKKRR